MKNKDDRWYWELSCGHVRMIKGTLVKPVPYETEVYCRQCDDFVTLQEKAHLDY